MKTVSFQFLSDNEEEVEALRNLLASLRFVENVKVEDDQYVGSGYGYRHKVEVEGYKAGFCAMGPKENPYKPGTEYYRLWESGWSEGQEAT